MLGGDARVPQLPATQLSQLCAAAQQPDQGPKPTRHRRLPIRVVPMRSARVSRRTASAAGRSQRRYVATPHLPPPFPNGRFRAILAYLDLVGGCWRGVIDIESVIDDLYAAAIDMRRWPDALAAIGGLLGGDGAEFGHLDLIESRLSFLFTWGMHYTPERVRQYEALIDQDPRLPSFMARPYRALHCRSFLSTEELHASRVYREVLAPDGVEYSLGVNLNEEQESMSFFAVLRSPRGPAYVQDDCERLQELVPHMRRVLRLHRRFANLDLARRATFEVFEGLPLAIWIVREDGEVVIGNRAATQLAQAAGGLNVVGGRIAAGRADETRRLRQQIADRSGSERVASAMRIAGGEAPMRLLISPLSGELSVIFVNHPDNPPFARSEHLQHLFGLTRSEARLVELLVDGGTVRSAGQDLGLTNESARQYLKSVFAKTGTHRQSDLVRAVLASPAWLGQRQPRSRLPPASRPS